MKKICKALIRSTKKLIRACVKLIKSIFKSLIRLITKTIRGIKNCIKKIFKVVFRLTKKTWRAVVRLAKKIGRGVEKLIIKLFHAMIHLFVKIGKALKKLVKSLVIHVVIKPIKFLIKKTWRCNRKMGILAKKAGKRAWNCVFPKLRCGAIGTIRFGVYLSLSPIHCAKWVKKSYKEVKTVPIGRLDSSAETQRIHFNRRFILQTICANIFY